MSKLKFFLLLLLISICGTFTLTATEKLKPIPMPLYQGELRYHGSAFPEPHRDESVRKWIVPSVRIRVPGAAGSGTICHYDNTSKTAYVISCSHLFHTGDTKATVEVFYKNNQKLGKPQAFEAKVLSFKANAYGDDISFMTFQPDWVPSSWFPIAPVDHIINMNETYFSCGCDHAEEVACYFVKPQGEDGSFLSTIENSPRPGRSGGGLMDKDGWYVGICVRTSNTSGTGTGYFVLLKTIHDYCHKNNLDFLLNIQRPNDLLKMIPIIDRNQLQRNYPPNYIPIP